MSDSDQHMPDAQNDTPQTEMAEINSGSDLFMQYLEEDLDLEIPTRGDLRQGIIVEIRSSEILVNVGGKQDGVVPQADLTKLSQEFLKSLNEGDTVDVVIGRQPDDDSVYLLSMSDALQRKDWVRAQELLDNEEITRNRVIGYNKGGLTVQFSNLRGFIPASHVVDMPRNLSEEQRREQFEQRVNTEMNLQVIEVERRRRRLVMSQMLAERKLRAAAKDRLFETLTVGDVVEGVVRSMRPFGAFVDIGGADGLLHVSEIDWAPLGHPRDALEIGEKLDVQVIRLDQENGRIALSRKRVLPNPWDGIDERYQQGDVVPVRITRIVDFGAFAQLEPGVEGLIHVSEMADVSVAEPLKSLASGDEVTVKILRIDAQRQRVGLSRRQAPNYFEQSDEDAGVDWDVAEPEEPTEPAEREPASDDSNDDRTEGADTDGDGKE